MDQQYEPVSSGGVSTSPPSSYPWNIPPLSGTGATSAAGPYQRFLLPICTQLIQVPGCVLPLHTTQGQYGILQGLAQGWRVLPLQSIVHVFQRSVH